MKWRPKIGCQVYLNINYRHRNIKPASANTKQTTPASKRLAFLSAYQGKERIFYLSRVRQKIDAYKTFW
ncbi:hypothetical protein ArsFIN_33440 [Arsenophonus nasoniae]|uniref:Uncharacterized protein n=1 Tax=Arsenophonus nasoniae TaxID=638 RepID=A0A4P7KYB8_9GAMM|nr:hypothetical protein ArsFIN_11860 [Arsenophonus nasoniae]QBY43487.1 hypothetical protein ArsFIN_20540 [Arsenophonus nasoniae]QBY43700.1 hypothetical protein ArsFIN_22680 [Arsenophonus nasoniae]QBY44758.1 hypothetical protein ArsFIN_33440 [Arsenophonus nasoniae]